MNLVDELRKLLPADQVTTNATVLEQHSKDESYHDPHLPDVVVFPKNSEEVSRVVQFAHQNEIPVVPFGVGSSLEGHPIPYHGGISLDFQLMNQIVEIRPKDFLVRVQPGVTRMQLNKELQKHGLFFSVDPGADATLGGMAANNASGTTAVRYGVMRDQVRSLEVVLSDGRLVTVGSMAAKSSSGYHLTGLFVGSEGTLGVFTELTLRVYGIPEAITAVRAAFPTVKNAMDAAYAVMSAGIPVARIELVDARSMRQVNLHNDTHFSENPTLFLEFHGNEPGLQKDMDYTREIVIEEGCVSFESETDSKARNKLWEARHFLAYAFSHAYPAKKMMNTDVCVPLSELTEAVVQARTWLDESGLDGGVLGHIGDGNYHALIMFDPHSPREVEQAKAINARIVEFALERGGTSTGEHGVGVGKIKYQAREFGQSYEIMKDIKKLLDPKGILNPGKIFGS